MEGCEVGLVCEVTELVDARGFDGAVPESVELLVREAVYVPRAVRENMSTGGGVGAGSGPTSMLTMCRGRHREDPN